MRTHNLPHVGSDGFYHCNGGGFTVAWNRLCEPKPPTGMGRTNGNPNESIGFRTYINHRMPTQ